MPRPSAPVASTRAPARGLFAALALAGLAFAPASTAAEAPAPRVADSLARIKALIATEKPREAMALARALYRDLAARAGFGIARTAITTEPATGFGVYEPRPDNVFAPGEPMHVYVELYG